MSERPTFSPFWHRVRSMKPRLRPHVEVTRQRYRGRRWHVVHDPAANQFYRLNPIAHEFVGMLDGSRDVEAAWKISLAKFGDAAPTQNEVIQLLSQLYNANLLSADASPETEQLLRRGRERVKKKIQQQAIGIMYFRMRLFNPDRLLTALEPIVRPILNRWGLLAWAVFVAWAIASILPEWGKLVGGFDNAISPSNWGWLAVVFVVTKAIHEFGHGVICKRFGGQVPEMGAMLLVLFPAPYVDASACWAFPSKWQRMAVGAGGMIFELFVASVAAFVWLGAEDGSLLRQIAYNAMLTASISTILFNANPLMRFDGYYILADLLEIPNLMQRSTQMLKYLMQKHVYRLERATSPTTQPGERAILVVYGLMAMAYRIFLFISITLFVMGKLFVIGVLLAAWTAAAWFLLPVGSFVHWLASSPQLSEHRARAVLTSLALIAGALLAVGAIPFPDYRRAMGVVESPDHTGVFVGTDGFVIEALARPGAWVEAGDPVLRLESPELVEQRRTLETQLEEVRLQERRAQREDQPAVADIARTRAMLIDDAIAEVDRKIGELTVRAPHRGVVVGADPARLVGAFLRRGDGVCQIVDTRNVRVVASLGQEDAAWLFDESVGEVGVQMRLVSNVDAVIEGANIRRRPAGRQELAHAALGFAGGGQIATDPRDQQGRIARRPQFSVLIDAARPEDADALQWLGAPGERVRLRFCLPSKPLAAQWIDRLHKLMQGRAQI